MNKIIKVRNGVYLDIKTGKTGTFKRNSKGNVFFAPTDEEYEMTNLYNEDLKMNTIYAKNNNTSIVEGTLDYEIKNNEYHIRNTNVLKDFRNKGVGRRLAKKLQNIAGNQDIYIDTILDESMPFWNKIAKIEVYKTSELGIKYYKGRIK